ncbi:hypothetical protein [Paenibacillus alkalitolerans]|uniref:hypothetical protein n=1 Tax=Paenibacillus alkalitolerans TaxID=2799335 RepID=UPI0018F38EA3|nr:hypothetical protein [Paenibacillus alkalitolerans]
MVQSISSGLQNYGIEKVTSIHATSAIVPVSSQYSRVKKESEDLVAVYEKTQNSKNRPTHQQIYKHPLLELFEGNSSFLNGFGKKLLSDINQWAEQSNEESGTYLDHVRQRFADNGIEVTDEELLTIGRGMDEWLQGVQSRIEQRSEHASPKLKEKLLDQVSQINNARGHLQNAIQDIIDRLNGGGGPVEPPPVELPPVEPPPVEPPPVEPPPVNTNPVPPLSPTTIFTQDRITIEIGYGTNKSAVIMQSPSSVNRSDTLFYAVDALGNKKAVTFDFSNSALEREFFNRFKKSRMYGETVSLEKFNRFVDRLKDYLRSLSDIDIDRLKSRLSGESENSKFDSIIQQLDKFLHQLK